MLLTNTGANTLIQSITASAIWTGSAQFQLALLIQPLPASPQAAKASSKAFLQPVELVELQNHSSYVFCLENHFVAMKQKSQGNHHAQVFLVPCKLSLLSWYLQKKLLRPKSTIAQISEFRQLRLFSRHLSSAVAQRPTPSRPSHPASDRLQTANC